ncbi:MAG: hypothetical protein WBM40_19325, partial [Thiohalocapsa sp.]
RADRSAHSLLRQIDGILDYVRLEAGDLQIAHAAFDLSDVIQRVAETAAQAASDTPLTVRIERDPTIPDRLVGDARRLSQLLTTLADNVAKAADAGEIVISARLLDIDSGRAHVAFEIGSISRRIRGQQPFESEPATSKVDTSNDVVKGNGASTDLSLGISPRLVAALGGRLQTEPGKRYAHSRGFTLLFALASGEQPRDPSSNALSRTLGRVNAPLETIVPEDHLDRDQRHPQMDLDAIRLRLKGERAMATRYAGCCCVFALSTRSSQIAMPSCSTAKTGSAARNWRMP